MRIFFLDSIGHTTNLPQIVDFCRRHKVELTKSMGGLQKDFSSCSLFCTDQAFHMSKIADLHNQLDGVRTKDKKLGLTYNVDPINLTPVLVKNAQSSTFIEKYLQKHPEHESTTFNTKNQTLRDYVKAHQVKVADGNVCSGIVYKQARYRERVNQDKGYATAPTQQQRILENAQKIIVKATRDILNIKVELKPRATANGIAFYYQALLLQIDDFYTFRNLRDAHTILNLKQSPPALMGAISQKKKEIAIAMQSNLTMITNVQQNHPNRFIESTEAHALQRRIQMLYSMNFDTHLTIFKTKTAEMTLKAKSDPLFAEAAQKASELCLALENAKEQFLLATFKEPLNKSKQLFGDECQSAIRMARTALNHHREWGEAIKKFLIDVVSFLTAGYFSKQLSLFSRTVSARAADVLYDAVTHELQRTSEPNGIPPEQEEPHTNRR